MYFVVFNFLKGEMICMLTFNDVIPIIDYLNNIIGFTYAEMPTLYILCFFFVFWFLYQIFGLIYRVFGIKK